MSLEDRKEVPTRKTSRSPHQSFIADDTGGIYDGEHTSIRADYEPNQPAPADALSPRRIHVRPRHNEVGTKPAMEVHSNFGFLAAFNRLKLLHFIFQFLGQITHNESTMKVALSAFKDLSPCDSLSWISNFDDSDLEYDANAWAIDSNSCLPSANHRYYPEVASLDPVHVPIGPATDRKRKRSIAGKDTDSKSLYDNPNFIDDEPTQHDVFLGRGGKANTHIGNASWLEEKTKLQSQYAEASKGTKKKISQLLVNIIHSRGGRFLQSVKFQDKPPVYRYIEVVDNSTLLKKASQTLRETNSPDEAKRKNYLADSFES